MTVTVVAVVKPTLSTSKPTTQCFASPTCAASKAPMVCAPHTVHGGRRAVRTEPCVSASRTNFRTSTISCARVPQKASVGRRLRLPQRRRRGGTVLVPQEGPDVHRNAQRHYRLSRHASVCNQSVRGKRCSKQNLQAPAQRCLRWWPTARRTKTTLCTPTTTVVECRSACKIGGTDKDSRLMNQNRNQWYPACRPGDAPKNVLLPNYVWGDPTSDGPAASVRLRQWLRGRRQCFLQALLRIQRVLRQGMHAAGAAAAHLQKSDQNIQPILRGDREGAVCNSRPTLS